MNKSKKRKFLFAGFSILGIFVLCAVNLLTVFVVPPIGAIPEGLTVVILRTEKTKFIDSPDAMCKRIQGYSNLLCRGIALGAMGEKSKILIRLPYFESLLKIAERKD